MITEANSKVTIGTVIDFPEGKSSLEKNLKKQIKQLLMEQMI